jgi:TonB family protein
VAADAGFGIAAATPGSRPAARAVADPGFGDRTASAVSAGSARQAARATDFDTKPQPQSPTTTSATAPARGRGETALEILSKPTPAYTDEARSLKIEGEVLLEVNFLAGGGVKVIRVVRGLGHGLDEAAIRAAEGMLLKPAQSAGYAVDFHTTVHIVFRLA